MGGGAFVDTGQATSSSLVTVPFQYLFCNSSSRNNLSQVNEHNLQRITVRSLEDGINSYAFDLKFGFNVL